MMSGGREGSVCTPGVTTNQLGTECQGREGNLSGSGEVSGDTTEEVLWSGGAASCPVRRFSELGDF